MGHESTHEPSDDGASAGKSVSAYRSSRSSAFESGSGHGGGRRGGHGRGDNARGRTISSKFCNGCNKYRPISDFPAG